MKYIAPFLVLLALTVGMGGPKAQSPEPAVSPQAWYVTITHDVEDVPNPLIYRQSGEGFPDEDACKAFLKEAPEDFAKSTLFVLNKLKDMGAKEITIACTQRVRHDTT